MKFLDRLRSNLSSQYSDELSVIDDKIAILLDKMDGISLILNGIEKEKNFLNNELKQLNKNFIGSKNVELYKIISDLKADIPKIEQVIHKLKQASRKNDLSIIDEYIYVIKFSTIVKELNAEISKIISGDTSQQLTTTDSQSKLNLKFLSALRNVMPWNRISSNANNYSFRKVMRIINSYENSKEELLVFNDALNTFISKSTTQKNMNTIKQLENLKRKGEELFPEEKYFLEVCESCNLWETLVEFYDLVEPYESKMGDFSRNSEKLEPLLKRRQNIPETISKYTETREKIKSKTKELKDKTKQTLEYKKDLSQANSQLSEFSKKKQKLKMKQSELPKASLRELGFKTKKEAVKKLDLESKDYVIIPIPERN